LHAVTDAPVATSAARPSTTERRVGHLFMGNGGSEEVETIVKDARPL
jgi:hypothetical protein